MYNEHISLTYWHKITLDGLKCYRNRSQSCIKHQSHSNCTNCKHLMTIKTIVNKKKKGRKTNMRKEIL